MANLFARACTGTQIRLDGIFLATVGEWNHHAHFRERCIESPLALTRRVSGSPDWAGEPAQALPAAVWRAQYCFRPVSHTRAE